jgi:transcription elongation factor Elf1
VPNIEPLATPEPEPFACPNCGARYTLVRAEADRASVSGQVVCRGCGGPLNGREGRFVFKYFLVDRPKIPARATRGKR